MTRHGNRLLQAATREVRGVLADSGWMLAAALSLGLIVVGLPVLTMTGARSLLGLLWGASPTLPYLVALPARYLSAWLPTWLVLPVMAVGWLAGMYGFFGAWRAISQARLRRLVVALATCAEAGILPTPKLTRAVKRAIRRQAAYATDAIIGGVQDPVILGQARLWVDAGLALDAGDYQGVAAVLAQLVPPSYQA